MEFVLMERLWADSSGQDSYDPYTCAVNNALFLECLDIAGARTLGNSLSDSVAYNMSGSSGDLNKNFYAILELEGLLNMTSENVTGHFGGDVSCGGKVIGDGAVNAYDMATLMWYQFKFEPYDQLPNDPSTVATVQGRDDTSYRCNLGENRRMWQLAVGEDYCHSGQNAKMLGYSNERRLLQNVVPEGNILSANLLEAYKSDSVHTRFRKTADVVQSIALGAKETRNPSERRAAINQEDMLRNVNSMRTLDIDVAEWGVVEGYGRWIRMRAPGVQVAMEIYLSGLSVDDPVHLSLQSVPTKNCTNCKPIDEDPRSVVIAFARRTEYEDDYSNAIFDKQKSLCANIVPAALQSSVLIGNTIALRQQPPNYACGFDIFLWVPSFPKSGVHVSMQASPYSFSARRLAAVGAESAFVASEIGCDKDIGVLAGSSAMDGFRGRIQRTSSCTRYGFTKPEVIHPVTTTLVAVEQCAAMACNVNAPDRTQVISRSFNTFESSGLENAYSDSLKMLELDKTTALVPLVPRSQAENMWNLYSEAAQDKYLGFEMALARDSLGNNCCNGYVCTLVVDVDQGDTTGVCQLQPDKDVVTLYDTNPLPPSASKPSFAPTMLALSPPVPSPSVAPPTMEQQVVFSVVVADETVESFNQTNYKLHVSWAVGVDVSCISLTIQAGSINVNTTIRPEHSESNVTAEQVKTELVNAFNGHNEVASTVLGVKVERIVADPEVQFVPYVTLGLSRGPPLSPPPPPSSPISKDDNDNTVMWVVLVIICSVLFVLICFAICMCFRCSRQKDEPADKKPVNKNAAKTTPGNESGKLLPETFGGMAEMMSSKDSKESNVPLLRL